MPTPRSSAASTCLSTSRVASSVACQISSGACSTQPGLGKCCANSWYPRAVIVPSSATPTAGRLPAPPRRVLDPARPGEVLRELLVPPGRDRPVVGDDDGRDAGRAGVDG